nr:retrotransposon protein, putative, unclassified [Tanacetum cinerariifolium]
MELETIQTSTTANLPMLKQGDYEMWRLRIEQYFQVQDYALWDVIENGNSFKRVAQTTTNDIGTSTTLIPGPVTTKEKRNKSDLDTMSIDDLYNNFKIVKQEKYSVKIYAPIRENNGAPLIEDWESEGEDKVESTPEMERKTVASGVDKVKVDIPKQNVKPARRLVKYAEIYKTQTPRGRCKYHQRERMNCKCGRTPPKAMVAIDRVGFDWSYMAEDVVPTNMALMAFLNSKFNLATYKRGLAYVEEQLIFYKKNEVIFSEKIVVLKRDISYKDSKISVLKRVLEKLKQEKESNQLKIENFDIASTNLDKLIGSQIPDNSKKGLGYESYHVVPYPPTGLFSPPKLNLSNSCLEEFQQPKIEGYRPKTSKSVSEDISNEVKESPDAPLVKDRVLDNKDCSVKSPIVVEKKTVVPTVAKIEFVRAKQQEKLVRKPVKYVEMYRLAAKLSKGKGGSSTTSDMLPLGEEPKEEELLAEAVNTACYVQNMVLVVKPHNKTLYELFRGRTLALSFMRPFRCHVTILNTLDHLRKFDGKYNDGFFVGYSLNSKAFRVYNLRTRKWKKTCILGTNSNDFVGIEESIGEGHSRKEKRSNQYHILMPLWKDGSLFDSSSKNTSNDKPQPSSNAGHKDDKARIAAIRLFLARASFMGFMVYQMDVKSAFLYGRIEEEVYVCQPPGFEDPDHLDKVYKVVKELYGLHQALRAWPDIMFVVCAYVRFQVTSNVSHLHAVKRIFNYLKRQPKLGLWYPKDSPFEMEPYTESDYAGASLDRKSTIRGCQFLRSRLVSWQ